METRESNVDKRQQQWQIDERISATSERRKSRIAREIKGEIVSRASTSMNALDFSSRIEDVNR